MVKPRLPSTTAAGMSSPSLQYLSSVVVVCHDLFQLPATRCFLHLVCERRILHMTAPKRLYRRRRRLDVAQCRTEKRRQYQAVFAPRHVTGRFSFRSERLCLPHTYSFPQFSLFLFLPSWRLKHGGTEKAAISLHSFACSVFLSPMTRIPGIFCHFLNILVSFIKNIN